MIDRIAGPMSVVFLCVVVPVVLGALLIGLGFLINLDRFNPPKPDHTKMEFAQPGDCVLETDGKWSSWGSCDDPAATKQIRSITQHPCIDTPGVDASWSTGTRTFCLGDKSLDPATSVNGIVAGECTDESGGQRQDCAAPGHRVVLAVLENEVALNQPTGSDPISQSLGGGAGAACRDAGTPGRTASTPSTASASSPSRTTAPALGSPSARITTARSASRWSDDHAGDGNHHAGEGIGPRLPRDAAGASSLPVHGLVHAVGRRQLGR
ncbi:hypothetical protein AADG42_02120 [Ammonicoccus fulvus]|uniref:Uncharacterized protein n=1 Tax=Ammonicoccus fulvus TaxID=3138240 RepID=A0ABZ3FJE0_9ACTN